PPSHHPKHCRRQRSLAAAGSARPARRAPQRVSPVGCTPRRPRQGGRAPAYLASSLTVANGRESLTGGGDWRSGQSTGSAIITPVGLPGASATDQPGRPAVTWWETIPTFLMALTFGLVPGLLLSVLLGLRGMALVGSAPAFSITSIALASIVAPIL